MVFPVSATILERIQAAPYRTVLEDYSSRLLPLIQWEPTNDGNVRVLNDTAGFYRFFDATPHAEFLPRLGPTHGQRGFAQRNGLPAPL